MAEVVFSFGKAAHAQGSGILAGQPRVTEAESGGSATTATANTGDICRAKATNGNSYVAVAPPGTAVTSANGWRINDGDVIEMACQPGDVGIQVDV